VAEPDTQTRRQSIASPTDCFAFSGAGWLTPFHCGAARALLDHGVITPTTKVRRKGARGSGGRAAPHATCHTHTFAVELVIKLLTLMCTLRLWPRS
jgi:hypothetical protein